METYSIIHEIPKLTSEELIGMLTTNPGMHYFKINSPNNFIVPVMMTDN